MVSPAEAVIWVMVTVGALTLGVIAFFLLIVTGVLRVLGAVFGGVFGRSPRNAPALPAEHLICHQPRCGHRNALGSRFCGRCGARLLRAAYDVDSYG